MKRKVLIAVTCFLILSGISLLPLSARDAGPAGATKCLSVPASAFMEKMNTQHFYRDHALNMSGDDLGFFPQAYYTPVYLPDGAKIKKIILICSDQNTESILLKLFRNNLSQNPIEVASVQSTGSSSVFRTFVTTAVSPRFVNNFKNTLYLYLYIPDTNAAGYTFDRAKIIYTYVP